MVVKNPERWLKPTPSYQYGQNHGLSLSILTPRSLFLPVCRLCLKHSEFSDKIRAQILGEQSPLTPPTCPPPSHLPHPSHPPHTSQSVTTLFSSVSQPILFGDIRHVDGPSLISNFDERRTTFSGKALKEGLPPSAAGTSQGLPPSSSIKDRATQGLPPSIPIKEGSKQGFTKEDASNKQGLPQQTTIHNQNLARTNRDENQEHHVPRHAASSKRVLPPTGQRSKEGLPPPKQTTITIEPNTRKRRAVDEQEVSSLNNHRATKEVVLPPKKKHKPDVLHIASNVSTCEPSAGGDSSEGETPVVESSLLSPAFVNEINVLNQEERDIVSVCSCGSLFESCPVEFNLGEQFPSCVVPLEISP